MEQFDRGRLLGGRNDGRRQRIRFGDGCLVSRHLLRERGRRTVDNLVTHRKVDTTLFK